ncbi:fibrinogen-like protein 1 [Plakobranchus ocellatus]|uniref:Fibrinogen-like protein 1 n=1 Tax=Plakobranchus ocellatus TaxID=259542 RepID=A0AAV4C1E7_9GAST|nr:fibrinogen-like protein 1 [Plakobranchus ocellatus]
MAKQTTTPRYLQEEAPTSSRTHTERTVLLRLDTRRSLCCLMLCLLFVATDLVAVTGEKTITATTRSDLCSYTLVVHEFDVSQCSAQKSEYKLADGADRERPHDDAPSPYVSSARKSRSYQPRPSNVHKSGGSKHKADEDAPVLSSLVQDVENKLLEEMVRNRALNSTLARHEALLQEARHTLEAYRSNFTSVFYQMMQVERKLHRQRRINRSLNKKLSNVILDVVEVNNVISTKLPASTGTVGGTTTGKQFAVESSSAIRACPGISNVSKQHQAVAALLACHHAWPGACHLTRDTTDSRPRCRPSKCRLPRELNQRNFKENEQENQNKKQRVVQTLTVPQKTGKSTRQSPITHQGRPPPLLSCSSFNKATRQIDVLSVHQFRLGRVNDLAMSVTVHPLARFETRHIH